MALGVSGVFLILCPHYLHWALSQGLCREQVEGGIGAPICDGLPETFLHRTENWPDPLSLAYPPANT